LHQLAFAGQTVKNLQDLLGLALEFERVQICSKSVDESPCKLAVKRQRKSKLACMDLHLRSLLGPMGCVDLLLDKLTHALQTLEFHWKFI